jgi:beta-lactam-binding protein with PASTA domain
MRQADAVRALQDAGYKLGEVSAVATDAVPVGMVAAQDPAAFDELKEGESVSLAINFNNGVDALVPSVIGLEEAVAVNVAESTGFTPLVVNQYVSSVDEGVVAAQVPDAESQVEAGATLVIVVSSGAAPETAAVPDVVGKTSSDAESAIKSAGFKAESFEVYDSKIAKGKVITQLPEGGTSAVKGSTVQIVSSLGPGTGAVKVPSVTGKTEADATKAVSSAGLSAEVLREYSDTVAAGIVSAQFPEAGTTAAAGTQVAVVVSLGKKPSETVPVPAVAGMTQDDAVAAVQGVGLSADLLVAPSSTVPSSTVSYQYPAAGSAVLPGSSVLVVVSSGP